MTRGIALLGLLLLLPAARARAAANEADSSLGDPTPAAESTVAPTDAPAAAGARAGGLEALVPEVANEPYRLEPGERPYLHRLSVSPAYGSLGAQRLFALRVAFNPNRWLGYEGSISHNPGRSVHAVIHSLNGILRHPLAGRYQPYLTAGYGMMIVFPGQSLNAASVTKNAFTLGGGLEFYIRSDLAIRAELAQATVLGKQRDREGVVAYNYLQQTIGLSFYRSITP